eukprot:624848-Pelagomonas_calceolata.AAC.1
MDVPKGTTPPKRVNCMFSLVLLWQCSPMITEINGSVQGRVLSGPRRGIFIINIFYNIMMFIMKP